MRAFLTGLLLVIALAAGCSSSHHAGSSSIRLRITVWPAGKAGPGSIYTLRCPGGAGTLPSAGRACIKLSRLGAAAFAPVPRGVACTEIYGGPQLARVSGTLEGRRISTEFSRTNGCEIER
jgi:hypothetical protein